MQVEIEGLKAEVLQLNAELAVLRALLWQVVAAHPGRSRLLAELESSIEQSVAHAPAGTKLEYLVELRTRKNYYIQMLRPGA